MRTPAGSSQRCLRSIAITSSKPRTVAKPWTTSARRWKHGRPLPALLITDLNMPNMDGMQLIAEMQRTEALAALPIIEVSGTSPASLHMAGLTAPMRRGLAGGQSDSRPGRTGGVVGSFVKPIRGEKEKEFLA